MYIKINENRINFKKVKKYMIHYLYGNAIIIRYRDGTNEEMKFKTDAQALNVLKAIDRLLDEKYNIFSEIKNFWQNDDKVV